MKKKENAFTGKFGMSILTVYLLSFIAIMGLALASGPSFLYAADTTPPTAPSNLTASAVSGTRINLTWTASTDNVGVRRYRVERCVGVGCTNFAQITTVTGTTYSNTGLTQATSYSYRVRATDAAGNVSSYSNIASATTRDTTRPTVSAFTIPAAATTLTVPITSFTATDNVGVTGYMVTESSTAPSATAAGWTATAPTSYTFMTAGSKTLYAWAKDAAGNVSASRSAGVTITLESPGPEPSGWYAGDMHVHRSCGGSPESISSLYSKMSPENLAVISLLADMGNGEVQNPVTDLPLVNGQDASVSTPGRSVHWDAEWHWDATYNEYPHQALGGHVVALGLTEAHQIWEEYTYPIFNWAHQQNAIAGFVHMSDLVEDGIPESLDCCLPMEYPVEVALGSADFIAEDVTGNDYAIHAYYRLLNCGFRPGFAAGTDYPCNDGADLGSLLTYVQVAGGQMTYRNWIDGIANGRTVVSRNGHNEFLNLVVNGSATPGDEINLTGAGSVQVNIQWTAIQNLTGTIELVQNGVVVASQDASVTQGSPATLSTTVDFTKSGWLAARRMDSGGHQVHTGAVFVTVNNAPVRASVEDAEFYVQWTDNLITKTSPGGEWNSYFPTNLAAAQARYQAAKAIYQQIALEAGGQTSLSITTASLGNGTQNVAYSATLAASGGTLPYTWSIASGLPPGLTLNSGTGVISGTPTTVGTYSFTAQVADSGSPVQNATKALSIVISAAQTSYTIWASTTIPTVVDSGPDSAVELGVKFRSEVAGNITGIRFYKASTNTGTHIGNLWSSSGTLLATATFTGESASGWQQVNFSTPVAITANTVYVASYHTNVGHYSEAQNYFSTQGMDSPPLHALASGVSGVNGVYRYGSASGFPSLGWNNCNYWVDVAFGPSGPPPTLSSIAVTPTNQTIQVGATQQFTATGTYSNGSTQNLTSSVAWASSNTTVATITSAGLATAVNAGSTTITATLSGLTGSTGLTIVVPPNEEPGGPILVISNSSNPFSRYYAEILRTEGFNSFTVSDISLVTAGTLSNYDVAILGEMALNSSQVTMLSDWANAGGNLIAMRPDKKLASLLGLTDLGSTLSDAYLLVDTTSGPGQGIVNQTIQFHGNADRYNIGSATAVATLYSNATTATSSPAVTLRSVGSSGGQAAAFTYDLAKSVVYTRQGNPAWASQERDGFSPIRSDDLFYPGWINLAKVAIPQADEQQRLLANLIIQMNYDKKPLPRFWYFPRGLKAVVIMTGDNHDVSYIAANRFDSYIADSPSGCSVQDWECVRATAYIFTDGGLTSTQAAAYNAMGFEIALHVTTDCLDFTPSSLESDFSNQLDDWTGLYPSLPVPVTNRTHCIPWSDYDTQPQVELNHGMRLDTNYYYWPGSWVNDQPGFFTGSGMPMRFTKSDGTMIDVYQATTQMTDESEQSYPDTIDALLDKAIGPEGYYGAFTANMHTDSPSSNGSDAIIASAQARQIPVISARQMLQWLDGRNGSVFGALSWSQNTLSFTISVGQNTNGLTALVPIPAGLAVTSITQNGVPVLFTTGTVKGIQYATFYAASGSYQVTFGSQ